MKVSDILVPERTHFGISATSKKRLLEQAAQLANASCANLSEQQVFDALIARERLGSTGIGEGIAIPHCRIAQCEQPIGLLLRLETPIDFEGVDQQLVDLAFILLVPETNPEKHLDTLSHLANLFNQPAYRQQLRAATSSAELYHNAVNSEQERELAL